MSFDTLAPFYRSMEFVLVGGLLQRCRTSYLAETGSCRRALLLGEGPGRFLVELLRANPSIAVTCVDSSRRMIEQALRQLRREGLNSDRVEFLQCDVRRWQPVKAQFDLVATHFFLDCFPRNELAGLVANVGRGATPGAKWLLTDFRVPSGGWRKWRAQVVVVLMYVFFRAVTRLPASRLVAADEFLVAARFRLAARRLANFGLLRADLWIRDPG